jgi:hypothetical protein
MIHIDGPDFKDEHSRTLILRGVNLGGSSKVPYAPNGATYRRDGFFDHRKLSFVGRPFPLAEADEHYRRLKEWGFTFLRFLVTWEAIEHAGPGIYDEEYLDYLYQVVKKAGDHGINVFIDPHEDVWSRFSGGDGAPGWTFEVAGLDITKFSLTSAAITHQMAGDPFPRMIWPTNNDKYAAATLFTLFFGGADFAPQLKVDGVSIQEYLQSHYINAIKQVAMRLKDLPNVVGYDTLNEPSKGYIGIPDLSQTTTMLKHGEVPTPFQTMLLAAGIPQLVERHELTLPIPKKLEPHIANPNRVSLFLEGHEPIWKSHGVWDLDEDGEPALLKPDYFANIGDHVVDFYADYFNPFANRFAREIRSIVPDALIFVEGIPGVSHPKWTEKDASHVVHAVHWYDGITLMSKNFTDWFTIGYSGGIKLIFGQKKVRQSFVDQVSGLINASVEHMNLAPTLIGEVGIPFDMQKKKAYRTGDFSLQVKAMDASMSALEANRVSYTLWNYTADNTNERGDMWNDEDLSIFSRDQMTGSGEVNDGGRALEAILRPYAMKTAGQPLEMAFDLKTRVFTFTFRHDPQVTEPTEFYLPSIHYLKGVNVEVSDGETRIDVSNQRLYYHHTTDRDTHTLRFEPLHT